MKLYDYFNKYILCEYADFWWWKNKMITAKEKREIWNLKEKNEN